MKSVRNFSWENLNSAQSVEEIQGILLSNTGLDSPEKIQDFFSYSYDNLLDPFLLNGMKESCERIAKAIENQERIMVFGDFDADGVTSTVILVSALQKLRAKVSYRIPDRTNDGHGLKDYLIDEIAEKDVSLIITCDCAVNDYKEAEYAASKGIDVIITDHHEPDQNRFPRTALAVINPKLSPDFPDKNLSGSAVAFKLIQGYLQFLQWDSNKSQEFLDPYLEISAIGVVADCVPLVGENRKIVQLGLERMKSSQWDGIRLLLQENGVLVESLDESTIGFLIAPHLNAASRLGDVRIAVQLFLGKLAENVSRIEYLSRLNTLRKELTKQGIAEAQSQIIPGNSCQIFFDKNWKQGILGLIATRFVQDLQVPVIVCTETKDGDISASCRSPKGLCIATALQNSQEFLSLHGGHAGAAGFITKKSDFESLKTSLTDYFSAQEVVDIPMSVSVFTEFEYLEDEIADFMQNIAPFGKGNPMPVFGIKDFLVQEILPLGKSGEHFKIVGTKNGKSSEIVSFFSADYIDQILTGKRYDLLCEFRRKFWRDQVQFEYKLIDARQSN